MIYIFIILLLVHFTILHDIKGVSKNKKQHYLLMFWLFFLLAGLRHGIGGDTYQFRIFWDLLPTWDNATWEKLICFRYEMGWVLLSFILKSIFGSFVFLQLLLSFILNIGIFKVVKKYSKYPFLVLLLFFLSIDQYFHIECTFMRQAYAVAIFLAWGVEYLEERKYSRYFIVILASALMHFSAVALLILPLLQNLNMDNKKTRYRFFVTVMVFFVVIFVGLNYTPLAGIKAIMRFQSSLDDMDNYIEDNEFVRFFNSNYTLILYYTIILLGISKYKFNLYLRGVFFLGIFIMILSPYINDLKRLIYFAILFIDMSLADVIIHMSKKRVDVFLMLMILFTIGSNLLSFQRYSNKDNTLFIYPYYSWFEEEPESHKKYFMQRKMDGHTIPFQIYDYKK